MYLLHRRNWNWVLKNATICTYKRVNLYWNVKIWNGKIDKTIDDRVAKGFGKISEIIAILSEVPLRKYWVQMGLHLRQAMFLNGVLFNSEACHGVTETDIKGLLNSPISLDKLASKYKTYILGNMLGCWIYNNEVLVYFETV